MASQLNVVLCGLLFLAIAAVALAVTRSGRQIGFPLGAFDEVVVDLLFGLVSALAVVLGCVAALCTWLSGSESIGWSLGALGSLGAVLAVLRARRRVAAKVELLTGEAADARMRRRGEAPPQRDRRAPRHMR